MRGFAKSLALPAYLVGAMAGVLELSPAFGCFLAPLTLAPFFSASTLPPEPGAVGAMLGVLELWLAGSACCFGPLAFAFAVVPGVSAFDAPPGFGCMLGLELDCALAASALMAKAAAASISVLENMIHSLPRSWAPERFLRAASENADGNPKFHCVRSPASSA